MVSTQASTVVLVRTYRPNQLLFSGHTPIPTFYLDLPPRWFFVMGQRNSFLLFSEEFQNFVYTVLSLTLLCSLNDFAKKERNNCIYSFRHDIGGC